MNIGIIGLGVVGSAIKNGFELIGHTVRFYDIRLPETSLEHILETDVCFICVPTPSMTGGACDVSIVEKTVQDLNAKGYKGVTVIKSTVTPGTTDRLASQVKLRLAFCPEFLRERCAVADFVENHDLCVIGTHNHDSFELVKEAHGSLPQDIVHLTPMEAEFAKYFSNVFNALRVTFANEFYEVCQAAGADYSKIKDALVRRKVIEDFYLSCNDNFRGFGGVCLPKDTAAFASYVRALGLDLKLFDMIVEENKKFKKTVLEGMREDATL